MSKRRSPGEGSIYQRKNGLWVGQFVVQGKKKYVYGKTRKDVAQKLAKTVTDREQGMVFDAGNMKLGAYLDMWLDATKDTVRLGTWKNYEMITRVHIRPTLGRVNLDKLNALHVQNLYRQKLDAGVSPRRVRYIHVTIHKALKDAVKWRLIPHNVAEACTPPTLTKKELKPLDAGQTKRLLTTAWETQPKLYALYVLAVTTGMRQGELLELQWQDVDLGVGTVQVRRAVFNGQVNAPKTNSSRRTVKLPHKALDVFIRHSEHGQEGWVFGTKNGTPLGSWNFIHKSWYPLRDATGLPKGTRFHDLRHTAATLLLAKNVNPKVVSAMLGHASIQITLDTYSHLLYKGQKYGGHSPKMLKHRLMIGQINRNLVAEVQAISKDAVYVSLGQKVSEVLQFLAHRGVLNESQLLGWIPHPSGASAERIKYFLGEKAEAALSKKTNPRVIDSARYALVKKVEAL